MKIKELRKIIENLDDEVDLGVLFNNIGSHSNLSEIRSAEIKQFITLDGTSGKLLGFRLGQALISLPFGH